MSTTETLLPCPFCGGEAELEEAQGGQAVNFDPVYRVQCSKCCRMDFPFRGWKGDAVLDWNRRATPPAPAPDGWVMVPKRLDLNALNAAYASVPVDKRDKNLIAGAMRAYLEVAAAPAAPVPENSIRDALEHVTELLVDTWGCAMEGDPEQEMAVKNARDALRGVAAPPSPNGWQDISSAPVDGTVVDLWVHYGGGERRPNCKFDSKRNRWVEWGLDGFDGFSWVPIEGRPTHWMPLPAAPAEARDE